MDSTNFSELIFQAGLFFAIVGGIIGLFLGVSEGVVTRVWSRSAGNGVVGFLVGLTGGFLGGLGGQYIYSTMLKSENPGDFNQIAARALGWAFVGLFIGLGQGLPSLNGKRILNGIIGGFIGGFAGFFNTLLKYLTLILHQIVKYTLL